MNTLNTVRAQVRGIGRSAFVGMLVGLLATQSFALSGPMAASQPSTGSNSTSVPTAAIPARAAATSNDATLNPSLNTSVSNTLDASALPEAPNPSEMASINHPPKFDPMISEAAQDGQSLQSTSTKSTSHGLQRPGFLVLGIVGAAAMGMGGYIYAIKTTNTSAKMTLGTMFMAPGAAAAGLGFYFAFKPKK